MVGSKRPWSVWFAIAGLAVLPAFAAGCGGQKPPALPNGAKGAGAAPEPAIPDVSAYKPDSTCATNEEAFAKQSNTPLRVPPANSPVLVRCITMQFHPENVSLIDTATYAYYIKTPFSQMSKSIWAPYHEDTLQQDFDALWHTNFLDNLAIQVVDEPYSNGVKAKHIIFHMEEKSKLKGVDYVGSKEVDVSKIEDELKKKGIELRLDSFIDEGTIQRVKSVVKDLYAADGYQDATITSSMSPVAGVSKLSVLTFDIEQGPRIQIRQIVFDGAKAFKNSELVGEMKDNRPKGFLSFLTGSGKYQDDKMADDSERVLEFYREHGYMQAKVGLQQIQPLGDSKNGKTRWVRLRIPVDEGVRYRLGTFKVTGNTALRTAFINQLFQVKSGDWVDWKAIDKARQKLQDAYGVGGYIHATIAPEVTFPGTDPKTGKPTSPDSYKPVADILMTVVEDKEFLVNRITLIGNTTTHDTVVRRELQLVEGGVFNVERLKLSIRRLNQLGYFKPLDSDDAVKIEEPPGTQGLVDVNLKVQEQNRNQITFGAGVSELDGVFGQLSFSTSNFLGRGESLGLTLQKGSQAKNYMANFTEPFLFDRAISAGAGVFDREFIYPDQFTQDSIGANFVTGFPLTGFTRLFLGYGLERDTVPQAGINPLYLEPSVLAGSPLLADELLINQGGQRTIGKISPSLVYDTVNSPIFPDRGTRYTAAFDFAGVGGDTQFIQSRLEGIWYVHLSNRTSLGLHVQGQYIRPYGSTTTIPIFQKLYLGGEYSIRGVDLRSIGPRDPVSDVVVGGNKLLLANAEYVINVGGPVRLVLFYDAGELRDLGQPFAQYDPIVQVIPPPTVLLTDPSDTGILTDPNHPAAQPTFKTVGEVSAIKTSTGLEVRFFMPVLNVPFRLIFAYNPQRAGVLNNELLQTKAFVVRFAVGTTF